MFKVYEWDFVKQIGELKHTEKDLDIALQKGKIIAQGFCEDEKPTLTDLRNGIWIWDTDCDFGAKIVKSD